MTQTPNPDEGNQRQLLASHRSQLDGLLSSIARVEQEKANGSLPAEVADPMIERWQIQVAAQRKFVDDALRNLGELPEKESWRQLDDDKAYKADEPEPADTPDGDAPTDALPARDERGQFKAKDGS